MRLLEPIRVSTLNIWNRYGPWPERAKVIRHELSALMPDVVGLQEVTLHEGDQAAELARDLFPHVLTGFSPEGFRYGNATLSQHPILERELVPLSYVDPDERRSVLYALLDTPVGRLPFFVTHLNWRLDHGLVRQVQVRELVDAVARLAPEGALPAVVVGDFNAVPESDEIRFMGGLTGLGGACVYFADCFACAGSGDGATFSRKNPYAAPLREPNRRLDYIFVSGMRENLDFEVASCRVCFAEAIDEVYASDHFGVVADLRFLERS